jgi:hypothetical protein
MNKAIGIQLLVYSASLAGLSALTYHLAGDFARATLIAGLVGGTLCAIWGLRVVNGNRGKALPLLTLVPVNFVLLSQSVMAWWGGSQAIESGKTAALLITLLLVISMGMLMRIAYAGMFLGAEPTGKQS